MNFSEIQEKARAASKNISTNRPRIFIGDATCSRAAGVTAVINEVKTGLDKHKVDADIVKVGCIGLCHVEPLVDIVKPGRPRVSYGNVTPEIVPRLIEGYLINDDPLRDLALGTIGEGAIEGIPSLWELPMLQPQVRIILRNCGMIDPERIDHYIACGGYSGLANALKMTPQQVIDEVKKSGLRGRGGAGFPTGMKWQFCHDAAGDTRYLICNADEGDPGAFMNRSVLESDPHAVLEGMLIGAYAIGSSHGYIYCRAEYPLAIERLKIALRQMEDYGLLGDNIMDSGLNFHLKIKEGAGAFVCGEETAMMASIEGKRGMPRPRPPFPAQSGLWGKPTNINNVETWANISAIFQRSSEWYSSYGTEKSKGTKTFALTGKINRTGLIEIPMGMPLRKIIYDIGGGIPEGKKFKAVQTGGPSGGCLSAEMLDLPVDYESLAQAGAIVGSGGMVVMDEETCMVDVARFFLSFTQSESCGKCLPCREGTKWMLDTLQGITEGSGSPEDVPRLQKYCKSVKSMSLCGLGQTAPNPVLTTLRYFQDEYEAHINEKRCPALVCQKLINFYILPDKCQGCGICLRQCPADAIVGDKRMVHVINQEKCIRCGTCLEVCPARFGAVVKVSGEKVEVPAAPIPVKAEKSKAIKQSENQ
jgi:NADH-quinone oxidoreductase subunit F